MEWLGLHPEEWSAASLLGVVVLMILFGQLNPRWVTKAVMIDRDKWRAIAEEAIESNKMLAEAAKENSEPSKTIAKLLVAAQERIGVDDDSSSEAE